MNNVTEINSDCNKLTAFEINFQGLLFVISLAGNEVDDLHRTMHIKYVITAWDTDER